MAVEVRITYLLSEKGRRDSLLRGGDGRRWQQASGSVEQADIECFHVDEDGNATLDLTESFDVFEQPELDFRGLADWHDDRKKYEFEIQWDVVPDWDDLLDTARQLKRDAEKSAAAEAEREKKKEQAGQAFLKDASARASSVGKDFVKVDEYQFERHHPVGAAAYRRLQQDQEALKQANRATLAEWVGQHGTENQRQRLAAGLLPWQEAFEAAENFLFRPTISFPLYKKFEVDDICVCPSRAEGETCSPKFQSLDATELAAHEWEQFSRIKGTVPGAAFQLREHRAECESAGEPRVRRGVIVKFTLGQLTFRREFDLTRDEVPF